MGHPAVDPTPTAFGQDETIGARYRAIGLLGSGGMGNVFEVEHVELGRRFALKLLRPELCRDPKLVERFQRESRVAASLVSEHVVSIVDSGLLRDGTPYFVMERLWGEDLRRLLERVGPLPASRAANIVLDACLGLHAAHTAGLVHRDLKPENLFVTQGDDGRDVCKLLDFGVAKLLTDNSTSPGALIGTARYMAPEQAGTDHAIGPRADIFGLGVILYECLTGEVPFDGDTLERVLFKVMTHEPQPLELRCPAVPPALARAVSRALAKDPRARFASARAFAEALFEIAPRQATQHRARPRFETAPAEQASHLDSATPAYGTLVEPDESASQRPARTKRATLLPALGLAALGLAFVVSPLRKARTDSTRHAASQRSSGPVVAASSEAAPAPLATPRASAAVSSSIAQPGESAARRSIAAERSAGSRRGTPGAARPDHPPAVSFDPSNPYAHGPPD